MATVMTSYGQFRTPFAGGIGRVAYSTDNAIPEENILLCRGAIPSGDLDGYLAILTEADVAGLPATWNVGHYESLDHLEAGDLVLIDGSTGRTRTVYRSASTHNSLFVTERCDNLCIMCSQPPRETDHDPLPSLFRIIDLLKVSPPATLGITGGEPTLLREGLVRLIAKLKADLPTTTITCLSNGRGFADRNLVAAIAEVAHPSLRFSIPLHADVPDVHDYIAQAKGAFRETIAGFYNLEEFGIEAEVRIVLHNQSIPRLPPLSEFIWRKLPFMRQVAFMGLEHMGFARTNFADLWIDPIDYSECLSVCVQYLHHRGMHVSVYNLTYCVIDRQIWGFARQSISDHKQILVNECAGCELTPHCSGFFASCTETHSRAIRPLILADGVIHD